MLGLEGAVHGHGRYGHGSMSKIPSSGRSSALLLSTNDASGHRTAPPGLRCSSEFLVVLPCPHLGEEQRFSPYKCHLRCHRITRTSRRVQEQTPKLLHLVKSVLTCQGSGQIAFRGWLRGRFRSWRAKTEEDGTDADKNSTSSRLSQICVDSSRRAALATSCRNRKCRMIQIRGQDNRSFHVGTNVGVVGHEGSVYNCMYPSNLTSIIVRWRLLRSQPVSTLDCFVSLQMRRHRSLVTRTSASPILFVLPQAAP